MSGDKPLSVVMGDVEIPIIKKESPNHKSSKDLTKIAEELGVNPFEILLHAAAGDWASLGYLEATVTRYTKSGDSFEVDVLTPEIRIGAAKEAAQYLYAKKRSIEVHGDSEADPISVTYEGSILDLVRLARGS